MTAYYAQDAYLVAEGIHPLQGHAAIPGLLGRRHHPGAGSGAQRTIRFHESRCSGGLGYALCSVTIQIPPAGRSPGTGGTSGAAWDATIWQRDTDGTWRIAVDISTPLPPPLPS